MTESIYNFWEICAEFSKKKKKTKRREQLEDM